MKDEGMNKPKIDVVIPAFNEENSVGKVIDEIPKDLVRDIIVVDNNSSDKTYQTIQNHGATALKEPVQGYGKACLKGLSHIANKAQKPDIVVFLDADYSDYPEEMRGICAPIIDGEADLVIGSRATGERQQGSMTPPQIFGNWLATNLIKLFYKVEFTDLGPFRAIDYSSLEKLNMQDEDYGWTVEMQVKAAKHKMRCTEVAVNYRRRIGVSKVSGTIKGVIMAGYKIIWTIFKFI